MNPHTLFTNFQRKSETNMATLLTDLDLSVADLEAIWIKVWSDTFNVTVEISDEYETGTALAAFIQELELMKEKKKAEADKVTDLTFETDGVLRSLSHWNRLGRWIKRGEKARDFEDKIALFHFEQTRAEVLKTSNPPASQTPSGRFDDMEDDIPF